MPRLQRPETRFGGRRQNTTPYPLRSRAGGGAPNTSYKYLERPDQWDGDSRPSFIEATVLYVLDNTPRQNDTVGRVQYQCKSCKKFFCRARDLNLAEQSTHGFITIDHKDCFRQWIWRTAEPDEDDGVITKAAAKAAYNDANNLRAYCNRCNSSKGGYGI